MDERTTQPRPCRGAVDVGLRDRQAEGAHRGQLNAKSVAYGGDACKKGLALSSTSLRTTRSHLAAPGFSAERIFNRERVVMRKRFVDVRFWGLGSAGLAASIAASLALALAGFGVVSASAVAAGSCPNEALRTGPSAALPDCRAYEQVSPQQKAGFGAVTLAPQFEALASPGDGDGDEAEPARIMYMSGDTFGGATGSGVPSAHLSTRTSAGWQTTELAPPVAQISPPGAYLLRYYPNANLSNFVLDVPDQQLTPEATPDVYNLFLRGESGTYSWINDADPAVAPPAGCRAALLFECFQLEDLAAFAGASSNMQHILFESEGSLVAGAPEGKNESLASLYESTDEAGGWHVSLAGILPDGTIPVGGSTAGAGSKPQEAKNLAGPTDDRVEHAISEDGSHVVFEAASDEGVEPAETGQAGKTEVYDRVDGSRTIELSAPAEGAAPKVTTAEPAKFWVASANGERVFFTSPAELTSASNTGTANNGEDLYECRVVEVAGVPKCLLTDLTIDTNPADETTGAGVLGVVGVADDGSYVYFVAKGELVAGKGVDGKPNLYMVHNNGAPAFIATLQAKNTESSETEEREPGDEEDWAPTARRLTAYVTADGQHMAFMSVAQLPTANFPNGYDNTDAISGKSDSEVYEYSAPNAAEEAASEDGHVVCVSCDPAGAEPRGDAFLGGSGRNYEGGPLEPVEEDSSAFMRARSVSEDGGRVFFTSAPLASELAYDSTETTSPKVYEYESDGEGGEDGCHKPAGCIYLLSSPNSEAGSPDHFLGASADGDDVYLATASRLAEGDQDQLVDVYDARVDGGFPARESAPACESGCRGTPGAAPQGSTPLSWLTGPSGNLAAPPAPVAATKTVTPKKKTAAQVRAEKLAKALKACRSKPKAKRRLCEAGARKRYGAHTKAKKSSHDKSRGR